MHIIGLLEFRVEIGGKRQDVFACALASSPVRTAGRRRARKDHWRAREKAARRMAGRENWRAGNFDLRFEISNLKFKI